MILWAFQAHLTCEAFLHRQVVISPPLLTQQSWRTWFWQLLAISALWITDAVTPGSQPRFVLPARISSARWWCKKERAMTDSLSLLKVKLFKSILSNSFVLQSRQPLIKSQLHSFSVPYSFKEKSNITNRSVLAAYKISPMSPLLASPILQNIRLLKPLSLLATHQQNQPSSKAFRVLWPQ